MRRHPKRSKRHLRRSDLLDDDVNKKHGCEMCGDTVSQHSISSSINILVTSQVCQEHSCYVSTLCESNFSSSWKYHFNILFRESVAKAGSCESSYL